MRIERSICNGEIVETKQVDIDGIPTGIVIGHIATWQPDAQNGLFGVPDRIIQGAYTESIQEHKARKNRQIRLKFQHAHLIGGFPIKHVKEDNIGLFAEGHINLSTQIGRETHALAAAGTLVDFSIGHVVQSDKIEGGERIIEKARVVEASIVDEPKNRRSQISEVKSAHFANLPIPTGSVEWNEDDARERIMELKFADGNGADAFVGENIIADVIDGKLFAIPQALRIAAEEVKSNGDKAAQVVLERYFIKMDAQSPFDTKTFYAMEDVKSWTDIEFKNALTSTGIFSNGAVKLLIARSKDQATVPDSDQDALGSLIEKIREAETYVNQ